MLSDKESEFKQNLSKHSDQSLTNRSLTGVLWLFSGQSVHVILQFIVVIVLARFLTPYDFGLVGAAMVVITFSQIFSQLGVVQAIIQRRDLQEEHIKGAFSISMLMSLTLSVVVFLAAPFISLLFQMEDLTKVVKALALIFPITGLSLVAQALLQREMRFREIATIDVFSYFIGFGIIGIVLALKGFGVWSLVIAQITQMLLKTIGTLMRRQHSVGFLSKYKVMKDILVYGLGYSTARIGNYFANQGDKFVVGRWLGADALGIYGMAYRLIVMPANLLGTVIDRVLFPAMATIQSDNKKLSRAYKNGIGVVAMLTIPISMILIIIAPEIINIIFGSEWSGTVIPFQILASGLLFRTSYKLSDSLARAKGAVYRQSWRHWVYAILIIIGALIGQYFGVYAVALAVTFAIFVHFVLMLQLSIKLTGLGWIAILVQHLRHSLIGVIFGGVTWSISMILRHYNYSDISIIVATVLSITLTLLFLLTFSRRIFGDEGLWVWTVISPKVGRRINRINRIIKC